MRWLGRIPYPSNRGRSFKVWPRTLLNRVFPVRPILSPLQTHSIAQLVLAAFLSSLLKDIKSERPKITEKDNLRLLFVTKWFLEFFLHAHTKEKASEKENNWDFGFVAEVTDRAWIAWVLKRMREALDAKVILSAT